MHEYDIALKTVLKSVDLTMRELAGAPITRWWNVELPEVQNTRVDLLGETEIGELIHIELQASNDPRMALRMAEYFLRVFRSFDRSPHQVVLYVGEPAMNMQARFQEKAMNHSYRLVDIRELNDHRLLDSPRVGDNIVAVLAGTGDRRAAVQRVLNRIAELDTGERETALSQLAILAGLRKLGLVVAEEAKKMPILNDILDHDLLGPEFKKGVDVGVEQGVQQGFYQGEMNALQRLIEKRFGATPAWVQQRLSALSLPEIEDLTLRVLEVRTIQELFE